MSMIIARASPNNSFEYMITYILAATVLSGYRVKPTGVNSR